MMNMRKQPQEPLTEDQIARKKKQRGISGIFFILLVVALVVIGFIDGDFFGETPQQKVFATVIGICVVIGAYKLLFGSDKK